VDGTAGVALEYFQALSDGDVDGAVDLVADDGDFRSPMGQMPDKEAVRAFLGGFDAAFQDAHFDLEHVLEAEGLVAVEGVYRGTHNGPLLMPDGDILPGTGRKVRAPFVTMFEIAGGKIRSHRPYWDVAGFMAQLTG
jgi:steroid delta-isomerase-like uncharacterized protein